MNGGFVKTYRQIKSHTWLNKRSEWYMGWSYIIMNTNYETGYVNLTETFRELQDHFDNRSWNYFIEKLEKHDMLIDVRSVNQGSTVGHVKTAIVTNYFFYHENTESKRESQRRASVEQNVEQNAVQHDINDMVAESHREAARHNYVELNVESNKNTTSKEIKEPKEVKTYTSANADMSTGQLSTDYLEPQNSEQSNSFTLAELTSNNSQGLEISTNGQHKDIPRRRGSTIDFGELKVAYNDNCGALPKVVVLNAARKRKLKKLVDEHGYHSTVQMLEAAARQVAGDQFWVERGYGFDNLLNGKVVEKAEKYLANPHSMSAGDRRMAQTYMNIMDAIGGAK